MSKLEKGLRCQVCTELLYQPFNLPCGHVFCYGVHHELNKADISVLSTGSRKRNDVQHVENELLKNPRFRTW